MFCVLQIYPVDKVGAQHYSWEEFVEKISVDEYEDGEDLSPLLEELAALHEHPFNLNTATKDDLEQLPFLDGDEIEEILAYVYRYGPMQSLGELMLIEELDYQTRQFLTLFVYVENPVEEKEKLRLKTLLKEGRHEVTSRLDVPLYKRDGYKIPEDEVLLKNPIRCILVIRCTTTYAILINTGTGCFGDSRRRKTQENRLAVMAIRHTMLILSIFC